MPFSMFLRGLIEAANLAAELLGDREPGSVVARPVDALAGAELLDVLRDVGARVAERAIREHRAHVVVDNHVTLLEVISAAAFHAVAFLARTPTGEWGDKSRRPIPFVPVRQGARPFCRAPSMPVRAGGFLSKTDGEDGPEGPPSP